MNTPAWEYRPGCDCRDCKARREAADREREMIVMGRIAIPVERPVTTPKRAA